MKVWILQLFALWVWSVHHIMANGGANYTHPKPSTRDSGEDMKVNNGQNAFAIVWAGHELCVEADRFVPMVVDCKKHDENQQWEFDEGIIRSLATPDRMCLTCNEIDQGSEILILPCDLTKKDFKVWRYNNRDDTLVNEATKMLMDLRDGYTGAPQQMILWPYNGGGSQKWYLEHI